jgi:hypothetical protein
MEAWIFLYLEHSITGTNTSSAVSTEGFEKETDRFKGNSIWYKWCNRLLFPIL